MITCRDCGNTLEATARGCPNCALNLEAEKMIDRFVRKILPMVLIAIIATLVIVFVILKGR